MTLEEQEIYAYISDKKNWTKFKAFMNYHGIHNASDREDILQTAFMRLWQYRHRYQAGTSVAALLTTILRNEMNTVRRKESKRGKVAIKVEELALKHQPDPRPISDTQLAAAELLSAVQTSPHYDLILCAEEDGYDAAAMKFNLAEGTVKSRVSRERKRLRGLYA